MLWIVDLPLQRLGDQIVYMDVAPLAIADDHLRNAVVIHIGDFNGADVLRRLNGPAWELPANVVRIDKLPIGRRDKLLVLFARKRREFQV